MLVAKDMQSPTTTKVEPEEQEDYSLSSGKVKHDYHDHANEQDADTDGTARPSPLVDQAIVAPGQRGKACRPEENFPVKLHYMLAELERDGLNHIVSWQPHGRCFVVHKQQQFVQNVLPFWFRQTKFPSFQRQLNLYGFKRLTSGRDKNGYYHELFLRSKRFLAHRINRIKIKGTGARKPSSPETEPNFYALPFLPNESADGLKPLGQAAMGGASALSFVPRMNPSGPMGLSALQLGVPGMAGSSIPQQLLSGFPAGIPGQAPSAMPQAMLGQDMLMANLQRERLKQVLMATHGLNQDASTVTANPGTISASVGGTDANAATLAALQQQQQLQQQQLQQLQHQQLQQQAMARGQLGQQGGTGPSPGGGAIVPGSGPW